MLQKTVKYYYDALGRRTKRTVTDTTTTDRLWTYDGNEILSEYDGSLNVLATYTQSSLRTDDTLGVHITSAGTSAGLAQTSGSFHFLKDALGSVTDIVDSAGNLVQHYVYSSFGKIIAIKDNTTADVSANAPIKTAYTFTNREWDAEAGLYYYRARYYAPEIGRFLQEDKDPGLKEVPGTLLSKHLYTSNNPNLLTDPTGFSWVSSFFHNVGAEYNRSKLFRTIVDIAVIVVAFYIDPVYAASALASTVSDDGGLKLGNGKFATKFAINFGLSYAIGETLSSVFGPTKDFFGFEGELATETTTGLIIRGSSKAYVLSRIKANLGLESKRTGRDLGTWLAIYYVLTVAPE